MTKFPRDSAVDWASGRGIVWHAAALVLVAAAYFVLAKFGLQLASINPSASPIWAPTGVALAAVLLCGTRIWPAVFVAAFAVNFTTTGSPGTALVIAAGNTLEALAGGFLIVRWAGTRAPFETPVQVAKFVAVVAGPAAILSATLGVTILCLSGLAPWAKFSPIWVTWWLGDLAGALVVTPVLVLWVGTEWAAFGRQEARKTVRILGLAVAIGLIVFSPLLPRSQYTVPLGFLSIVPLVWAALRRGPRDTATVSAILTGFAVWGTVAGAGPFAQIGLNEAFVLLLTFMISLSVPSLVLSADVAIRRRTEESLRRSQDDLDRRVKERTAALADANIHLTEAQRIANLGSWSWDIAANRVTWSDQLRDIYGVTAESAPARVEEFVAFLHPDDRDRVQASIAAALEKGGEFSHEERIVRPDGGVRQLQSTGEVVRGADGRAVRMLGICLDITERRRAESTLRETEQSFQFLLKGVRDYAIYMLDPDGRVQSWSDGAQRIKGYRADEIVGRHFSVFLTEEGRAAGAADEALAAATRDGQFESQLWLQRKDGSRFYASVVMDAIHDDSGRLLGFAKFARDITEQHDAQTALEQTREQLAQAQKMEALGQLTGGIAHDFNNLLMIVSGYAQLLQRRLTDPKETQAVEAIRAAASRGERLTRQLLTFSRRQQLTPVAIDLRRRIDAVRDMLAPSLHGNIELVCDIEEAIWPVEADLGELELALVNIAVNARDAMPDGGTITLQARNVMLRPGVAPGGLAGEFVALAVADNGSGIAPDVLARVFEPFFTTKPVGKGTGLGLSQVHGFANQAGGTVTVTSDVGKGTAVTIYLPRSLAVVTDDATPSATPEPARGQGTVLLVEDSREVADVTTTMVEQLGYRVVRIDNAADALRRLEEGMRPDLLFSDIVMPGGINGIALAQACRERYPDIPVLLTTGFTDAAQAADGRFAILRKPFELAALERAVDVALRERRRERRALAG